MHVRDVGSQTDRPDSFPRALYRGATMKRDKSGFYYSLQDRDRGVRVRYHTFGTPADRDPVVFGDGYGKSDWVSASVARNGKHVLFHVQHGWAKSDLFVQDLQGKGPIVPIVSGLDALFSGSFADDHLIVQTNFGASNGRIVEIDPAHPGQERWRTIVPAGPDPILDYYLVGGSVLVHTLHDVTSRLELFGLDGKSKGKIAVPSLGRVTTVNGHWETDEIFVGFESYTTPAVTLRGSVRKLAISPWWRSPAPFASDDYETTQVWVPSKDGTKVPMMIVAKKGLSRDGNRPTLLYGYGGFNSSVTPRFSTSAAWLVEQGGVYAVANLRGGGEFGEAWHRAGMLEKKQNVFDDFIASAEWLIANGYTKPERLGIRGGSNGGLLVGVALTQRPDLFRAVLCEFPDLDMIGYARFKNNNPPALLEYGDASKPEHFKFLYAYSPYQHVKEGESYPAVLLTTGDEDTRVPPLQARKMTARLQGATSSGRPVYLLYDEKAGHSGGKPLHKGIDDEALELAFLASQLGI